MYMGASFSWLGPVEFMMHLSTCLTVRHIGTIFQAMSTELQYRTKQFNGYALENVSDLPLY